MGKKILIVGGQGFIGSHITNTALQKGFEVTVLCLHQTGFPFPFADIERIEILSADTTSIESLEEVLKEKQFQYVVNCSGYIDHTLYQNGGRSCIEQHFTTVMNLVQILDRESLESFVQIGSSDEYGNQPAPQDENFRESPISPYAFGKVASTQFLQMLYQTEKFPATIVRIFLTYGPGQNSQRFLPQIIQGCLQDKYFPTSAGVQLRDFCYISDIVEGIFKIFSTPQVHGNIINLASGQGVSIRTIIKRICQIIGKGQPEFGKIPYRSGENMELFASINKAKNLLDWTPQTALDDGLQKTIWYYQERFQNGL